MRFFSNDARESTDEQSADDPAHERTGDDQVQDRAGEQDDERPDRVQSDPVAVPHQRPGSPWSDSPSAADADAAPGRDDSDAPAFHEPAPQPTAFGASTVGGAVAASAGANPDNDRWDATDRVSSADKGVGDDAVVAPGDGVVTSSTTTYAGDTADSAPDTVPATWTEKKDADDERDRGEPDDVVDVPLDDKDSATAADRETDQDANRDDSVTTFDDPDTTKTEALKDDGTFDDPKVADTEVAESDTGPLKDDGGFDDPQAVDPVTETPLDQDSEPGQSTPDSTPPAVVAAPVPTAAVGTPGPADTLFDQDDARAFQERWRDVQLRFVDSPKEAAADAAKLVDEAVEKLTAGLRAQRDGLHNDTEDTEQLRVQLRGYREILNRILSR